MSVRNVFFAALGLAVLGPGLVLGQAPQAASKPVPVPADVPYSLSLDAFTIPGLPGLHSFAIAGEPSSLVLLAGRTNGLHGFAPSTGAVQFPSFPPEYANDTVYVVDLPNRKLLGQAKVTSLPSPYANQLQASNVEYLLSGGFLYIVGGYGLDPKTSAMVTLPFVTAIDFDALVTAVVAGGTLDSTFAQAHMASFQHPALAITGGDLAAMGSSVLLIYGQQYDGQYTPGGGPAFQEYSNSVRVLTMQASKTSTGVSLQVAYQGSVPQIQGGMDPENPYHRRDLTTKPALDPTGNPRIAVYGGVFKGGRLEGYLHPIYISPGTAPGSSLGITVTEDTQAEQLLSQYDGAALQVFSKAKSAMYTTFFGGISQLYWNASCGCLKLDPAHGATQGSGLPFISSISTFRVTTSGSSQFLHQGASFPPAAGAPVCQGTNGSVTAQFLGAETKLVPAGGSAWSNGVLQLDGVQKGVIGYLVGGIAAYCPPGGENAYRCNASTQGASCASNQIYAVTLDPGTPTPTVLLKAP
jgi:hypothetical protein